MRRAKKGLAILASTVLMVTSAVNYHGLTFSTNVYSEETSNAETVSEVESAQAETEAAVQAETVQPETVAAQVETEAVQPETVAVQAETEAIVQSEATEAELISEATQESSTVGASEVVAESEEQTELAEAASLEETSESAKPEETTETAETEPEETKAEETKVEETTEVATTEVESEVTEAESTEVESLEETSEEETETSEAESEEESPEAETEDGFTAMSLLPLEEIQAYLHLEDKTEEEVKNMSIDEVLNSLVDRDGNKIAIRPENATTAWYKDRSRYVEQYVEYPLGENKKIDLFDQYVSRSQVELIVGSKNQLDTGNKRYIIIVDLAKKFSDIAREDQISYELYFQDESGTRKEVTVDNIVTSEKVINNYKDNVYNYIDKNLVHDPDYWSGKEYYLGISSPVAKRDDVDVDVDVYTYEEYVKFQKGLDAKPCTDQILNQDMTQKDSGRKGTYKDDLSDETSRIFWIRYRHSTGREYYKFVEYSVESDAFSFKDGIYSYDGEQMNNVSYYKQMEVTKKNISAVNSATGKEEIFDSIECESFRLQKEYSESDAYYYVMDMQEGQSSIVKVVEGLYKSIEQVTNQPDIKEQLIQTSASQTPRGYKANYSEPKYFTIFRKNGSVLNIQVEVDDYYNSDKNYTEAPIIGQSDPWFRIYDVKNEDTYIPSVVFENSYSMNLYTMYGYGYQTVLIQDETVDLSQLRILWGVDKDHVTKVTVNGKEVQSGQIIDCSKEDPDDPKSESNPESTKGTVHFTITVDEHPKEYYITFVKAVSKEKEQKLFVAGPKKQEVFLNEYTEYKHDILIANLGQEELTGLRVELNATNCKLDDYWTVGGENNNTLAGFDSVETGWNSVLGNVAKVRLVPSNAEGGKIEGTLTVYADGQEPIVIELLGYAQNPRLVTNQETFSKVAAVKYVPYSYMFSTNNMYDWVDVSYELEGDLPAGIKWYPKTGEIYGTPTETGTFKFKITANFTSEASYGFSPSSVELTLTVDDNTAENVYKASSDGYSIKQAIGTDMGDYKYVVTSLEDAEFISNGVFTEFNNEYCDVWLNGKRLTRGEDYDAESGSTRITIHGETFENTDYVNQDGENTIAIEFRKDGKREEELKRTSQNFTIDLTKPTEQETTEESTTAAPTKPTVEPTKPTTAPTKPTTEESTTAKATTAEESTKEESTTSKHSEASTTSEPTTGTKVEETKKEEAKSTVVSTQTPETAKENETSASATETTAASVTCTVKMVDAENKAINNLNLELHSTPQKTLTDANGCAAFDSIEFGSHTLYVKNTDGATEGSVSFTIAEGNTLALNGNVITAPNGADFILTVRYDQNNLELLSIHDNAARSSEVILGIEDYAEWIGAFLFGVGIAMAMYLCVYAISSAVRRRR